MSAVEKATKKGLDYAQGNLASIQGYNARFPAQQGPADYVANPQYQGLAGGDYNAMQGAYMDQVDRAYDTGMGQMKNVFGANGMYGSVGGSGGLMSGAMGALNQAKMTGYNDALTQRYQMQQQDAQNVYQAGLSDAQRRQGYNQSVVDFNNNQALAQEQYNRGLLDWKLNSAMGLATGSMPGYSQQIAGDAAQKAANTAGMWNAAGSLAGGVFSNYGGDSGWTLNDLKFW